MDDHASDPIEETTSSDLLGEADGFDVDKEFSDDDKDDALLSEESLDTPSNVTAPVKVHSFSTFLKFSKNLLDLLKSLKKI